MAIGGTLTKYDLLHEYHYERAAVGDRDGKAPVRAALERQQAVQALERLARFTQQQEAASRRRRAARELAQRAVAASRAETDALIARSEQKIEAALTPFGQLFGQQLAGSRRGR